MSIHDKNDGLGDVDAECFNAMLLESYVPTKIMTQTAVRVAMSLARENVELARKVAELEAGAVQLLYCPHQEHFCTRLNDEEMKGVDMLKKAVPDTPSAATN